MTDAHCHLVRGEGRHFVCSPFEGTLGSEDRVFHGTHPWRLGEYDPERLCGLLAADEKAGVGEIGLDRLRERDISPRMREVFVSQLEIAAEFRRPAVLHGAKCWGEVAKEAKRFAGKIPSFLFHGFSRSQGLLPEIEAMNGFVSVGPAILNSHAVNYRRLAAELPIDRLLAETDLEEGADAPPIGEIVRELAALRNLPADELERILDANADAFLAP
ncbi:MAG: TatD family hydrolase [Kiritimatiellae bacterium]|nr:TatD family hydrolase [Kiritimatiellia bacterium]